MPVLRVLFGKQKQPHFDGANPMHHGIHKPNIVHAVHSNGLMCAHIIYEQDPTHHV